MRYQNWDVLLFPDQHKVPLQEFKTSCQVIQDPESHNLQLNPLLLPTVTSFIPGLPAGAAFRVSVHCWQNPEVSRYCQSLKKPSDIVMFEARLFIDGRLAGSKWFDRSGPWPAIIDLSVDLDKHGEFEKMRFPAFHKELLSQSYWNAGDDLGRIKVVISEGFSQEQQTYPFDRIKNIVSFSFQHAPLDVLEASSIAWPNAAMWRQVPIVGPYFAQQFSPRQGPDGIEVHSHSPRHSQSSRSAFPIPSGSMPPPPLFPRQPAYDPFITDHTNNPAFSGWRHTSTTDTSMPDYSSSNTRSSNSRQVSDPMQFEKTGRQFESIQMPGAYESLCEALMPAAAGPVAPANTPDNGLVGNMAGLSAASRRASSKMSIDGPVKAEEQQKPKPSASLKSSGFSNVRSRKENIQDSPLVTININPVGNENATRKVSVPHASVVNPLESVEINTISHEDSTRKASQPSASISNQAGIIGSTPANNEQPARRASQPFTTTNNSGTKRQRVVTPAATKVIDDEDEPRSSPSIRKASQASTKTDGKEKERIVLGGIENV